MRIYLFIAAVAGGVTYLLTPLIRHIAIEIGAVGEVRARDVHTVPTPRMPCITSTGEAWIRRTRRSRRWGK